MRFYKNQHGYYCGVHLHTKMMCVCIVDQRGDIQVHCDIRNDPRTFLQLLDHYRKDLAVDAKRMLSWYWLADLCAEGQIDFLPGHALYKAINTGKAKKDRIDSEKMAGLLRGGNFPKAYVYPS